MNISGLKKYVCYNKNKSQNSVYIMHRDREKGVLSSSVILCYTYKMSSKIISLAKLFYQCIVTL